ncbi:gas vesicle protein GvpN, partial [Patescibacteria group bacterium]|nr:gas vesicle protein GvpN [Patescibacteria group bacterium]
PEEYAGVHRSQDALRDRMVTMDLDFFDRETEIAITEAKSGISRQDTEKIVDVIRGLRDSGKCEFAPTVRGCIVIAKTLKLRHIPIDAKNPVFGQICQDVLASETSRIGSRANRKKIEEIIQGLIDKYC